MKKITMILGMLLIALAAFSQKHDGCKAINTYSILIMVTKEKPTELPTNTKAYEEVFDFHGEVIRRWKVYYVSSPSMKSQALKMRNYYIELGYADAQVVETVNGPMCPSFSTEMRKVTKTDNE